MTFPFCSQFFLIALALSLGLFLDGCGSGDARAGKASVSSGGPPAGSTWVPIPEVTDEFDGTALDGAKWQDFHSSWSGREPSAFYGPNVSVAAGNLKLQSTPDPSDANRIRAACVQSLARALPYGYYEARIKTSDISMTSSFWFQGKSSEMDVIENIGNPAKAGEEHVAYQMNMNTHYFPHGWPTDQSNQKAHILTTRVADDYHIYAMEWDADFIRYYLDGTKVYEQANNGRFTEGQTMFFDTEAFVWQGYPTHESLLDSAKNIMYVDWVRGWRKSPAIAPSANP